MGEALMKDEQLEEIGDYVKNHIAGWIKDSNIIPFSSSRRDFSDRDIVLSERIVRVEEGIKNQGDLLEKMLSFMEKRFEQVDKRFSQLQWSMGLGFTLIAVLMGIFNFF